MNDQSIWDDPELQTGDNYFSFDNVGDTLQGRIELIKRQVWADGSVSPQLFLTAPDGTDVICSCGQIRLKNELVAQRPAPGDDVWIRLTQVEPRGGGKTLKHFEVRVRRNNIPNYQSQFGKHGAAQQQAAAAGWQQPAAPGYAPQPQFGGQQPPAQQPQYGYEQQPVAGPGPFQQGPQPTQQPGPQPPAQQPQGQQPDPWAAALQQQLPTDDPWATPGAQQPQPGAGEPPF